MAKKSRENVQSLFSRLKSNESEPRGEPRRRQDRVETIGDGIIKDITMLRSLLARRQSRHEWTCIVVSKIRNRGYVYIYQQRENVLSIKRATVIGLSFPLPVSIQFENAPVPRRWRNVSIDSTGSVRSVSWRAKKRRKLFPFASSPACFPHTFSIKIAIVSNERIHQYLYARRVLLVIVLLFLVIAIPNDFVQSILKRSKVIFTNFTIW